MKKKWISLVLCFLMAFPLLPISARAEEPVGVLEGTIENVGGIENIVPAPNTSLMSIVGSPTFTWNDDDGRAYYYQLDEPSKAVYDQILESSLSDHYVPSVKVKSPQKLTPNGGAYPLSKLMYPALTAITYDKPELSWLTNVTYRYSTSDYYNVTLTLDQHQKVNGSGTVNFGDVSKIKGAVATAQAEIDKTLDSNPSRYQLVKSIHNHVCGMVNYASNTNPTFYQTAYSAFFTDSGATTGCVTVCAGYAKAFKLICDAYEIPCVLVSGTAAGGPHMWNYVRMEDNQWYAVDCTWDDTGADNEEYLLVGGTTVAQSGGSKGKTFLGSHTPSGDSNAKFTFPTLADERYVPAAFSNLDLEIPTPAVGIIPLASIDGPGYKGTITWSDDGLNGFKEGTAYTATVTLKAENPHTFANNMTATVNGNTAIVNNPTQDSVTVTYTFPPAAASVPAPSAELEGNSTVSVSNQGGSVPLKLQVNGIIESYNDIAWQLTVDNDSNSIVKLPETTQGQLTNGELNLGDLTVSNNPVGEPAKTATVKLTFSGNTDKHYIDLPKEISIVINLAAGDEKKVSMNLNSGTWEPSNQIRAYGTYKEATLSITCNNTGNVDATNVTAKLEKGTDFRIYSTFNTTTISAGKQARMTIAFPKGKDAGTYTDNLIVTSDICPEGVTKEISITVEPRHPSAVWFGNNGSTTDFTWEYTGEEILPSPQVNPNSIISGDTINWQYSVSGGQINVGENYIASAIITSDNPNYSSFTTTHWFTITPASRTINAPIARTAQGGSVVLETAILSAGADDGKIEYGYSETNDSETVNNWQSSPTFTGLTANTTYYFFARSIDARNYKDAISAGTPVTVSDVSPEKSTLTGDITIYGTTSLGDMLTVTTPTNANITPADYTIQWYRNDQPISQATSTTYIITPDDQGTSLSVTIIAAADSENFTGILTSNKLAIPKEVTISYQVQLIDGGENATGAGFYTPGEEVVVKAGEKEGYVFAGWKAEGFTPSQPSSTTLSFVMPENQVVLTGQWMVRPSSETSGGGGFSPTSYDVTLSKAQHGTITTSSTNGKKGDKITLTVTPDEGYELNTIVVKDRNGNNVPITKVNDKEYTFVLPEGNVTVNAIFTEIYISPFTDSKTSDWFYDAVKYVYVNGLMAGTSTTTFEPNANLNRAQAVQILYNLEGKPLVTEESNFSDVSNHWALNAIVWATENNVVTGVGDNKFDPNTNITREQFAQMLYNYAKFKGYDLSTTGKLSAFPDSNRVSDWAQTALIWANDKGLINGNANGTLAPDGTTIRGQAASILMNFDLYIVKSSTNE